MKKKLTGVVTSDKMDKGLRVEVERRFRHPKYGKIVRSRTICHVHDEANEARDGDRVEIVESRPHSKLKRWELVRVVEASGEIAGETASDEEVVSEITGEAQE